MMVCRGGELWARVRFCDIENGAISVLKVQSNRITRRGRWTNRAALAWSGSTLKHTYESGLKEKQVDTGGGGGVGKKGGVGCLAERLNLIQQYGSARRKNAHENRKKKIIITAEGTPVASIQIEKSCGTCVTGRAELRETENKRPSNPFNKGNRFKNHSTGRGMGRA